jgi:N-acetylmuramoyl-L-alanine amidase
MTKKIVFDPGHRNNANDWGASGNGLREAEVALKIVNYAVAYLKANYTGFEVKLTRSTNNDIIDLSARDEVADNWKADVFVSVHLNAFNKAAKGFETFVYNGPISDATVSLQNIMHNEILKAMRKHGDITDRGKKRANLAVLRSTNMPAILTENLFIDNAADATLLKKEAFLEAVGNAHGEGVAKYLGLPLKPQKQPIQTPKKDYIGHWAEKEIQKAIDNGIMTGYPNGDFGPNDTLKRGEMAAILDRLGVYDK